MAMEMQEILDSILSSTSTIRHSLQEWINWSGCMNGEPTLYWWQFYMKHKFIPDQHSLQIKREWIGDNTLETTIASWPC